MHHHTVNTQNEQGLGGGKQRHQTCYTDKSSTRRAGTHKALLQYSWSNCYQLPLQLVQKEALPEGRLRESNLAICLSPCLGRIFLLVDFGESLYWVDIHNEHPHIYTHTQSLPPKPKTRVKGYRRVRRRYQWNTGRWRQKSEMSGVGRLMRDIYYGTINIIFRLLRAVISGSYNHQCLYEFLFFQNVNLMINLVL